MAPAQVRYVCRDFSAAGKGPRCARRETRGPNRGRPYPHPPTHPPTRTQTTYNCQTISAIFRGVSSSAARVASVWRGEKHTPCPRSSQLQRRAMLAFAFVVTGFVSPATVLPGSQTVLPRVRRTTPLPPGRMAPCICSGGRVGGRSKRWKPTESEDRGKGASPAWQWFGPVQRAMVVLVPAVVIATACVPYGPLHGPAHVQPSSSICQVPALRAPYSSVRAPTVIESEAELEVLECLSSSVNYPGSRNDIAAARRDYVELPSVLNDRLVAINAKAELNSNAEGGQWAYPGWRVDALKALNVRPRRFSSQDQTPQVVAMASTMDREQMVHEKLPPSAASSVSKSARSNVGYAVFPRWDNFLNVILLEGYTLVAVLLVLSFGREEEDESRPILPAVAWITLPQVVYLACTSSSSLGFIPLVIVCTGCCLWAVLDDDVVGP